MARFKITKKSLRKLSDEGLKPEIVEKLESLKNKKFKTKAQFEKDLSETIGERSADLHGKLILKHSTSGYHRLKAIFKSYSSWCIIFTLILTFIFVYLYNHIVISVHSGQAAVLYQRFFNGTVIDDVYGEGIHIIWPWDIMYIYNVRVQEKYHSFDVLTKNGLKVHLMISVRYQPEYNLLGTLHKQVGPDYLNKVVIPEIESVLRIIIGQIAAEEVYTTKTSMVQESLNVAIEEVAQRFVKVDDVLIKRIILPDTVQKSIESKLEQKHMAEAHLFKIQREKLEAERKRIEAGGHKDYNDILSMSLNENILEWKAIHAALELSKSYNTKVVVIGSGKRGLPVWGSLVLDSPDAQNAQIKKPENLDTSDSKTIPEPLFKTDKIKRDRAKINDPLRSNQSDNSNNQDNPDNQQDNSNNQDNPDN
ncbi:prohibitin family protein, partial [Desulfobacterales bacterium HSG16]|nr:prohibitin family protein [Desulfobacterales bacterium HSG16]